MTFDNPAVPKLPLDTIITADCLELMKSLPACCIDAVITSPPYAEQRAGSYASIGADLYPSWMTGIAKEICRILKPSGSFVLNIKEHVRRGARDTYVLKTVLALSEILLWSDTYIWNKTNPFPTGNKKRLKDGFEYCYLFTKTRDYKFNPNNVLVPCTSKWLEGEKRRKNRGAFRVTNGSGLDMGKRCSPDMVRPSNVLTLATDCTNHKHPAVFPVGLPDFFIRLLTDEGDIVYDPFCGSGTTLAAAKNLNRHYIGTEIGGEYAEQARERMGWL